MYKNSAILFLISVTLCLGASEKPLLFRKPTISRTQIVFSYAGDLWIVAREGGDATRLTAAPGVETDSMFSPASDLPSEPRRSCQLDAGWQANHLWVPAQQLLFWVPPPLHRINGGRLSVGDPPAQSRGRLVFAGRHAHGLRA